MTITNDDYDRQTLGSDDDCCHIWHDDYNRHVTIKDDDYYRHTLGSDDDDYHRSTV